MSYTLTLATGMHERARPLVDGAVSRPDLDLQTFWTDDDGDRHDRFLEGEWDACELSMAMYVTVRQEGADLTAIPVFPNRRFRHSYIYVNAAAGITEPANLKGKRIGVNAWANTAAVWARGALHHDYGVRVQDVSWVLPERRDAQSLPPDVRVQKVPRSESLVDHLVEGKLDALITPAVIAPIRSGDPRVRRLFPDFKAIEADYFKRTGIFPISHAVALRGSVVNQHPELPALLWGMWQEAKEKSFAYTKHPGHANLAWYGAFQEEERAVFGTFDPWSYGIQPNQKPLDGFLQYVLEQGLVHTQFSPRDLFHPDTWSLA